MHIITSHKPEKPKPAVSQFVFVCMSIGNTCKRVSVAFHGKTGGPNNWMKPYTNLWYAVPRPTSVKICSPFQGGGRFMTPLPQSPRSFIFSIDIRY